MCVFVLTLLDCKTLKDFMRFLSFLSTRGIKDEICNFNARRITPEMREGVEELLKKNKASFDPKVCEGKLVLWLLR